MSRSLGPLCVPSRRRIPLAVAASGDRTTVAGGATTSLVAETTRPGGVHQLTYAGHPLYTFTGDTRPGTTNGQASEAFGARWDVLTVAGQEVTDG